jgi:Flp pilus assembly protein TadD
MNLWFEGHWGFQYYMESGGAKAVDHDAHVPQEGDLLTIPLNNTNVYRPSGAILHFLDRLRLTACPWLATMNTPLGAGFHSDIWGPLPFAFGAPRPEEFQLFLIGGSENAEEIGRQLRDSFRAPSTQTHAYDVLRGVLAARQQTAREIASTREALTNDPRNPGLHVRLGLLYGRAGELAAATEQYRQALLLVPDSPEIHGQLGAILEQRGRTEEALHHYARALELQPGSVEMHVRLASLLTALERLPEAISHLSEALRIRPDSIDGHVLLAGLFLKQGRFEEAIYHYERALELKSDSAEIHNNLGVTLAYARRFREAVVHLTEALRLKPDYGEASENLKQVLSEARRFRPLPDSQGK